jgi:hypothetical protein
MNVSDILANAAPKTDGRPARPQGQNRPPIQWESEPAHVIEGNHSKVSISRSTERFPRYSYRVGGKSSPFLHPHIERSTSFNTPDMVANGLSLADEVSSLLQQAANWVDEQLKLKKDEKIAFKAERDVAHDQAGKGVVRKTGKTEKNRLKKLGKE